MIKYQKVEQIYELFVWFEQMAELNICWERYLRYKYGEIMAPAVRIY